MIGPSGSSERRVALVTGAGRRVGRAIALALGSRGLHVVVHHNASRDGAEETARLIHDGGGQASLAGADLTDPAATDGLIDVVLQLHGGLLVVVNFVAVVCRLLVC